MKDQNVVKVKGPRSTYRKTKSIETPVHSGRKTSQILETIPLFILTIINCVVCNGVRVNSHKTKEKRSFVKGPIFSFVRSTY